MKPHRAPSKLAHNRFEIAAFNINYGIIRERILINQTGPTLDFL